MSKSVLVIRSIPISNCGRTQNTLQMLREAGLETNALCWDRLSERPVRETVREVPVRNCQSKGAFSRKSLFLWVPLWWVWEFFYLLFHRADCLYAFDLDTVVPALVVKYLKGSTLVLDIADFYAAKALSIPKPLYPLFNAAERFCARRADAVVIPDEARTYLLGKRLPRRLLFLENSHYDELDPSWKKSENKDLVIFYAGSLAKRRGLRKLVEATRNIEGVRLVIAGRTQEQDRLELFRSAPHVEFLGLIPPDEVLRRTFDADAIYTYYDPALEINRTANSTKMYEALMCGTAIICNSEPPAAHIIRDYECGACLPYHDDEALKKTIIEWRNNRELAKRFGRNARNLFEHRYNWRTSCQPVLQALKELGVTA